MKIILFCLLLAAQVPLFAQPAISLPPTPQSLFIVQLTTGPAWDTAKSPNDQPGFKEHSANLARMRSEGRIIAGARFKDGWGDKGMVVVRAANRDEVLAQFAQDPMIRDKLFVADIADFRPFYDGYIARAAKAPDAAKVGSVESLSWLAGCWAGTNGRSSFSEQWMKPVGGMMLGMGRTLVEGKVVSYESMRIHTTEDGKAAFTPKPSGKAEVTFARVGEDWREARFEVKREEFPQRVIYRLNVDGSLAARIEGERDGKARGIDFPMKRVACD